MKRTFLLICFISLFSIFVFAETNPHIALSADQQMDDDDENNSIVFKDGVAYDFSFDWKKTKKSERKRRLEPHWSGIGFSFANFTDLDSPGLDFQSSYSINWNILSASVMLENHWLLVTGVGIDWSRYHFKGDFGLQEVNGITEFVPAENGISYRDSKLLAYHFTIPLLLEYQYRDFFVNAGPVVYFNCYSKSQVEERRERGGGVDKIRLGKGLNILPVNVRLMAQIGIDDWGLFGYYSPISMFAKNKGPEIYPWGVGIMLGF